MQFQFLDKDIMINHLKNLLKIKKYYESKTFKKTLKIIKTADEFCSNLC